MTGLRSADPLPSIAALSAAWAVAKKDMRIYYLRPGNLMFGILFPIFLFLSFAVGRDLPVEVLIPGLTAMAMFFGSSSTGAMAIPTERRTKTYERLLVAPIPPLSILLGQTLGGFIFGAAFAAVPIALGVIWFTMAIANIGAMLIAIVISSFAFSALGIMIAALPSENPGDVMMLLNFVRLPLLFVSGIFVPLQDAGNIGIILAAISPLTYSNDLLRWSVGGDSYFGPAIDVAGIVLFSVVFLALALWLHERARKTDRLGGKLGRKPRGGPT
jgi:ABC-2 type transport system permease protein